MLFDSQLKLFYPRLSMQNGHLSDLKDLKCNDMLLCVIIVLGSIEFDSKIEFGFIDLLPISIRFFFLQILDPLFYKSLVFIYY